jgi:eukaryotic-like serine/threonine-protein kinase
MADRSTTPLYSEEQATTWLAWLAYNMQRRELTIFQIESLQPDWLAGWEETAPHLLLTRMLWGMWSGLLFGLIVPILGPLSGGPLYGPLYGLIGGLIGGLVGGLLELMTPLFKLDDILKGLGSPMTFLIGVIIYGLMGGLFGGLLFGLIRGVIYELHFGLIVGFFGLLFGFIRVSRVVIRNFGEHLRMVESLQWSWQHIRVNAVKGLLVGPLLGLLIGLLVGLTSGLLLGLIYGLMFGLIGGLFGSLISGLIGGFQPGAQKLKTRPNQGIWLTVRSSIMMGLPVGLILGILLRLLSQDNAFGFVSGAVAFFIVGGWYGGLDVIEHASIRLIIAWRGHAPLNYARFLDYAAEELNFLQKVGGGYVFIHSYLLEHFAEIAVEKGYVDPTARNRYYPAKGENPAVSTKLLRA